MRFLTPARDLEVKKIPLQIDVAERERVLLDNESHDEHADGSHQDAVEHKQRPVFFRNVGNTEKSAHVLNLGSHQEEGRRKNGDVMCIKGAAGEQAGCNESLCVQFA